MQRLLRTLVLAALAVGAASPAAGQVCNGLPFRGRGIVAASYLSGEAADSPFALRELGGSYVRQLPGWSPLETHHALRIDAAFGRASFDTLAAPGMPGHFAGSGGMVGASYTLDVLPSSYGGDYTVCVSAGLQRQWWRVSGSNGGGVVLPVWLSFGAPLQAGPIGVFPHVSVGAYGRLVSGQGPLRPVRERGFRPWGDAGVGFILGPARIDAAVRHEFQARERAVLTIATPF